MLRVSRRIQCGRAIRRQFRAAPRPRCGSTAAFASHHVPPRFLAGALHLDKRIQARFDVIQWERANQCSHFVLARPKREEFCLEVSARDGIPDTPANEKEIPAKWL